MALEAQPCRSMSMSWTGGPLTFEASLRVGRANGRACRLHRRFSGEAGNQLRMTCSQPAICALSTGSVTSPVVAYLASR